MDYEIELRPQSFIDLEESFEWYSLQKENLGEEFLEHVEVCLNKIKENPYSYPITYKKLRKAFMKKFPFSIMYQITKNKILVFSIFHSSRNPKTIGDRF